MISSEPDYETISPSLNIFARDWEYALRTAGFAVTNMSFQKIFFIRYLRSNGLALPKWRNLAALSIIPNWTFLSGLLFCLRGLLWHQKYKPEYDLILCHNFLWAGAFGCFIRKKSARVIIVEHNINKTLKNESFLHQQLLKVVLKFCDIEILCLSEQHSFQYTNKFNVVTRTVVNPISNKFMSEPSNLSDKYKLVSIGSLDDNKDQLLQLEILAGLPEKHTLTLIGEGYLAQKIQSKIVELGLTERVNLLGRKTRSEVCDILDRHSILLNTSSSETFGVVNTEAGCRGLFIVSYDNGGVWNSTLDCNREIISQKGNLDTWIDAIVLARTDQYDRLLFSQCYQTHFSVSEYVKKLGLK